MTAGLFQMINYVKKFRYKKVAHWDANNMQKLSRACLATS
jgi:hypothetical protein